MSIENKDLRKFFAAHAMQALLTLNPLDLRKRIDFTLSEDTPVGAGVARLAFFMADEMIRISDEAAPLVGNDDPT